MKPINKFETACFDGMIYYSRYHLGITGKSKFKRRDRLPLSIITEPRETCISVSVEDHPGTIFCQFSSRPV